jgi:hypothetical protein
MSKSCRHSSGWTRRGLLKAAAASLPLGVHQSIASGQTANLSPNDRIETAVIGIGERGKYLIGNLPPQFRVKALCDFSREQIETARRPPTRFDGVLDDFVRGDAMRCELHQDYRRMLDSNRYDAVIIAAPDHHHSLAAILAMQSGSHVYVEKPLAVTIGEGRAIVQAARRYGRVVQVGSQQRTMQVNRDACEFIRAGGLGRVHRVEQPNLPGPMPYDAAMFPARGTSPITAVGSVLRSHPAAGVQSTSLGQGRIQTGRSAVARLGSFRRLLRPPDDQLGRPQCGHDPVRLGKGRHGGRSRSS